MAVVAADGAGAAHAVNSFLRAMTIRAIELTTSVITNRNRPAAISAAIATGLPPASPNFSAMVDAKVSPPGSVRCQLMM